MPGNPNPAVAPYTDRSAAEIIAYEKLYVRKVVAGADAVRNGDWSGQYGGLNVRANEADYNIDTSSVALDDGDNVIIDAAGNQWIKIVSSSAPVAKKLTVTGDVTLADDEAADEIEIDNTTGSPAARSIYLPSAAVRTKPITITDVGGNANTYNLTILPKATSGQTIMTGSSYVIDSNGGGIKLTPNTALTGYR